MVCLEIKVMESVFLLSQITQICTDVCGLCLFVKTGLKTDPYFLLPQIKQIFTDVWVYVYL
jgi:2-iminoacetate synthase ThiH